jgi:hypothetical protein
MPRAAAGRSAPGRSYPRVGASAVLGWAPRQGLGVPSAITRASLYRCETRRSPPPGVEHVPSAIVARVGRATPRAPLPRERRPRRPPRAPRPSRGGCETPLGTVSHNYQGSPERGGKVDAVFPFVGLVVDARGAAPHRGGRRPADRASPGLAGESHNGPRSPERSRGAPAHRSPEGVAGDQGTRPTRREPRGAPRSELDCRRGTHRGSRPARRAPRHLRFRRAPAREGRGVGPVGRGARPDGAGRAREGRGRGLRGPRRALAGGDRYRRGGLRRALVHVPNEFSEGAVFPTGAGSRGARAGATSTRTAPSCSARRA